jgi:hypothetical protein
MEYRFGKASPFSPTLQFQYRTAHSQHNIGWDRVLADKDGGGRDKT